MASGDKDVGLSIGVEDAGLQAGMQKAQAIVKQASAQMQASMQGVSDAFKAVQGTMLAFTAVLAGGAAFKSMINASNEWAGQQTQLSKALGVSTEKASVMSVAMDHLGIDSGTVISASQKLSKQIFSNSAAFETMGIKVKDSAGNYRPVTDVMGEVNAKLLAIKNPIEQNIAGMQMYGKGWAEVKSVLKLTQEQMESADRRAQELGLIVGPEGAARAKQYKEQMADLGLVSKSLEIQFGNALLPSLTELGSWMSGSGSTVAKAFGDVMDGVGEVIKTAKDIAVGFAEVVSVYFQSLGEEIHAVFGVEFPDDFNVVTFAVKSVQMVLIGFKTAVLEVFEIVKGIVQEAASIFVTFANVVSKALQFDFEGAKQALSAGMDQMVEIARSRSEKMSQIALDGAAQIDKVWTPKEAKEGTAPKASAMSPHYDFKPGHEKKERKDKSDPSQMGKYEEALAEQKLIYATEHEGREMRSEDEKKFWENILTTNKVGGKDKLSIARKIAEDELATLREKTKNKLALNKEEIEEEERLRLSLLATDEENANQQLALGQITKTQLLQQQKVFEGQRYQIQKEAQSKRIALMRQEEDPAAYAAAKEKILELDRANNLKKLQIDNQLAQQENPLWKGLTGSMSSLWDNGISAMMNGTLRWKNALRATWTELAGTFANVMVKPIVANWAKSLTAMIAQKLGFAAQDKAVDATGATAAIASKKIEAGAVIPAEAAEAAGAAASSVAGIPYVGPAMAAAAYAETMALVMGGLAVASASGGYDIPSGINPVTQLHQEEMVLPAKYANAIRGMTENGGSGGGDVHYHDYSGRLTKSQIRENAAVIATELNRLHRDGWRPK